MVHHDLWEYDTVGPATLGEITVDGSRIKAVMQPSKTGFLYVFDRVTGQPVWPIEERPVPQSAIPGEHTARTQPFPTKPAPFARIGLTDEDLIDFTPALRERARELAKTFVLGPIFTPPSLVSDEPGGKQGTLMVPGSWGAGNWNTGAFDPDTGVYYAFSHDIPRVYRLAKANSADAEMDYWSPNRDAPYIDGLPIIKPPYGRIVAIDLNRGEHLWSAVNGVARATTRCSRISICRRSAPPAGRRRSSLGRCCSSAMAATSSAARTRRCGAGSSGPTTRRPAR
jgi:quinoprotein glucose dehydrogenase